MNSSFDRSLEESAARPSAFVPFTAFPSIESSLERHLGPSSKVLLPAQHQAGFVRALPWVALVFLPLHLSGVALLFGITALGSGSVLRALLPASVFVLDVLALPGLFKRSRRGWAFFLYALLIGVLNNVLSFSIFGLAVSAALVWLAFQVKYRYA